MLKFVRSKLKYNLVWYLCSLIPSFVRPFPSMLAPLCLQVSNYHICSIVNAGCHWVTMILNLDWACQPHWIEHEMLNLHVACSQNTLTVIIIDFFVFFSSTRSNIFLFTMLCSKPCKPVTRLSRAFFSGKNMPSCWRSISKLEKSSCRKNLR